MMQLHQIYSSFCYKSFNMRVRGSQTAARTFPSHLFVSLMTKTQTMSWKQPFCQHVPLQIMASSLLDWEMRLTQEISFHLSRLNSKCCFVCPWGPLSALFHELAQNLITSGKTSHVHVKHCNLSLWRAAGILADVLLLSSKHGGRKQPSWPDPCKHSAQVDLR